MTFSLPHVTWRKLPPLFYWSLGAFLGFLLAMLVLSTRSEQKSDELLQDMGASLAKLAAKQAIPAWISHDFVSMQAILQDIQRQPRVSLVTIHDLEQNLVVQAGQVIPKANTLSFSEPIPLHDSVAGVVTVSLAAQFEGDDYVRWMLLGISSLLAVMFLLAFYDGYGDAWEMRTVYWRKPIEPEEQVKTLSADGSTLDELDALEEDNTVLTHSDLILATVNRKRLQKQLSSELFTQLLNDFEHCIEQVLALYGGIKVGDTSHPDIYCIRFASSESSAEAAFRAVCCAYLLDKLHHPAKIRFALLAQICDPDSDVKLAISEAGIFIQSSLLDNLFDLRTEWTQLDEHRAQLKHFKAPFASLLERQYEQLLANRTSF